MDMINDFMAEYSELIAKLIADIKAFLEKLMALLKPVADEEE